MHDFGPLPAVRRGKRRFHGVILEQKENISRAGYGGHRLSGRKMSIQPCAS
jgi:hypothetical protein